MDTNEVVEGLHEIELTNITKDGYPKGAPDQFKLLQVLGQGSFGKVFYCLCTVLYANKCR